MADVVDRAGILEKLIKAAILRPRDAAEHAYNSAIFDARQAILKFPSPKGPLPEDEEENARPIVGRQTRVVKFVGELSSDQEELTLP